MNDSYSPLEESIINTISEQDIVQVGYIDYCQFIIILFSYSLLKQSLLLALHWLPMVISLQLQD